MPDKVFVRNIPDDLWRALKAKASLEGKTLSQAIQEAVQSYLLGQANSKPGPGRDPWSGITAIGRSGKHDVSEKHDEYLAAAIHPETDT